MHRKIATRSAIFETGIPPLVIIFISVDRRQFHFSIGLMLLHFPVVSLCLATNSLKKAFLSEFIYFIARLHGETSAQLAWYRWSTTGSVLKYATPPVVGQRYQANCAV